jgi:hypothetical protein
LTVHFSLPWPVGSVTSVVFLLIPQSLLPSQTHSPICRSKIEASRPQEKQTGVTPHLPAQHPGS